MKCSRLAAFILTFKQLPLVKAI